MAPKTEKTSTPPLISYGSFLAFLNVLREHGVPGRIDKTLMPKASGSQSSGMLAALRFLSLIDEAGKPQDGFKTLVLAQDEERKPLIAECVRAAYSFVFDEQDFDLQHATAGQLTEKFRSLNISGSTLTKTIAFFLAAAKDCGIPVSSHVKAPPAPKPNGTATKRSSRGASDADTRGEGQTNTLPDDDDTERFEIPLPGKRSAQIIIPSDIDADDWEMLQNMLTFYIKRWKGFKGESS